MTNDKFKKSIADLGIRLNGLFCEHDVVLNKKLEFNIRARKVKHKPNLKHGEVVIIKAIDISSVAEQISKDAIETVLAIHDIVGDNKYEKARQYDSQIKHQIELIKYAIIGELIKDITPIKQIQFYYSLGIKNAEQLVNGSDTDIVY